MAAFTYLDGVLTITLGGTQYQIQRGDAKWNEVSAALQSNDEAALKRALLSETQSVKTFVAKSNGKVEIKNNTLYYNGEAVHNSISNRIFEFIKDNLPHEPLMKFLERLMQNPSYHAKNELFNFLENKNLPITEDGCFLGYKAIKSDWTDKHTGTIDNSIGKDIPPIPRNQVDDDWRKDCSSGYHVGSIEYVRSFASGDDIMIIVKVDPADVVSVPDYDSTKMRVCYYVVVDTFKDVLSKPLYNNDATEPDYYVDEPKEFDWQDNWDDDYKPEQVTSVVSGDYGLKPDGRKYYNVRQGGKFARKD